MFAKLDEVVKKHEELTALLGTEAVFSDPKKMIEYNKALNEITPIVEKYLEYKGYNDDLNFVKENVRSEKDPEMKEMMQDEMKEIEALLPGLEEELKILLLPKDENDDKNVIVEIRGGAGGDEAALFSVNLYRMFTRYAERNKWKHEVISKSEAGAGFKEIIFMIKGQGAYSKLKFESGVHRVQRVPETEASGRIHTSTATVAVLPEIEDIEKTAIKTSEIKVDTFRSSGAGGQHVNTTDSAVRVTHLPTGIIVECQDGRSQLKNKEQALKVLAAKIYEAELEKQRAEVDGERKLQVGTGSRSEKIRTYNYPQGRVTDHRIKLTLHRLDAIMDGELTEMIDALTTFSQAELLQSIGD